MFDTVCTLPLASDLFSLAIHPTEPIISTGLISGHVAVQRLPSLSSADDGDTSILSLSSSDGRGHISTLWRTRRHNLSCRTLAFSPSGDVLFTAGADGLVKSAPTQTGQVSDKIRVSSAPCLLHALSDRTLLLACDDGALHLYDLREGGKWTGTTRRPAATLRPHLDYVTSITPLSPSAHSTSGVPKQWISTGGTTLAVSDLRRGVLVRSEDQEEALLSSASVGDLPSRGTSVGEKILIGGAGGIMTLWERGQWDDQDERIVVDKGYGGGGESLDVMSNLPDGVGEGKTVAVGLGDGRVRFVRIGVNKVVGQVRHDDVEGVVGIGFDVEGRMVTGGGSTVKVWHEKVDEDNGAYVDEGQRPGMQFSIYDDDDEENGKANDEARSSSDDEDAAGKRKKKRKGNSGGHLNGTAGTFSFTGLD